MTPAFLGPLIAHAPHLGRRFNLSRITVYLGIVELGRWQEHPLVPLLAPTHFLVLPREMVHPHTFLCKRVQLDAFVERLTG